MLCKHTHMFVSSKFRRITVMQGVMGSNKKKLSLLTAAEAIANRVPAFGLTPRSAMRREDKLLAFSGVPRDKISNCCFFPGKRSRCENGKDARSATVSNGLISTTLLSVESVIQTLGYGRCYGAPRISDLSFRGCRAAASFIISQK